MDKMEAMSKPDKINLEVYYILDLGEETYNEVISKCLRVFLTTQCMEYNLLKYEEVVIQYRDDDVIKRGLSKFVRMYDTLKLKTRDEVWFIYIGNGNVRNIHTDVSLILLNKHPSVKESSYVINRNPLRVLTNMSKDQKMDQIKNFTKSLRELTSMHVRTIKYNNIN